MGISGDPHNDMGFQNRSENVMNSPSSAMSTNPFFASAWNPIVSQSQHENFRGLSVVSQGDFANSSYPVVMENQGVSSTSHLGHYHSKSSLVELVPKFDCFGNMGFSRMVGSFGLAKSGLIADSPCPSNYAINTEGNNLRSIANGTQSMEDCQLAEDTAVGAPLDRRIRKRAAESYSSFDPNKDAEGELQKDLSKNNSDGPKKRDEKKPRTEHNSGANSRGKQAAKQAKGNSQSEESPKENYIHVRARRGQATNSHSLAERVRREKISERMRLLQELVPGCNKITGKAVMLDEIINYVQSLQQQVEFLSMKLATVNPELNIDIEKILLRDILHTGGGNASVPGFSSGMNSHGIFEAGISVIPDTSPRFPPVPQNVLDDDLQSLFQMGFESTSAIDSFGTNGRSKPEL